MRDVAVDSSGHSRRRVVIGTVLTGARRSAAGRRCGWRGCGPDRCRRACACSPAWSCSARSSAPASCGIVGAPVAAFRGMTGVLARDNAARNPKRTAATASALMIGVALVVLISVFAASARASIDANIDTALRSDWVITPLQHGRAQPDGRPGRRRAARDRLGHDVPRHARPRSTAATVQVTGIDPTNVEPTPRRGCEGRCGERPRCAPDRRPAADRDEEPLARRRRRDDDLRRDRCAALHRRDDLRAPEPAR